MDIVEPEISPCMQIVKKEDRRREKGKKTR